MIDLCTVSYNTRPLLERQLNTLLSDSPAEHDRPWHLFIADNDSQDDTRDFLRTHTTGPTAVLYNKNIGYARACNQLAALGEGDIIGLLNADVWLTTSDVMAIQKSFDEDPNMHLMGPKQRDERGNITHAGIVGTNTAPRHRGWHLPDQEDIQFRDKVPVVTVSGSAYFIRRSTWEALTNDEEYVALVKDFVTRGLLQADALEYPGAFIHTPHYYEETFCSYFANHRGYGLYYDGRVSIGHSWHASHSKGSEVDQSWSISQNIFREACDKLGIEHD